MRKISKKNKAGKIIAYLENLYPDSECALSFRDDPFRLLIMARLSAQCTDKRVNIVSDELFEIYPDAQSMSIADITDIEKIIKPCGLYKTKAQSLHDISKDIVEKFDGKVPQSMDELLSMNGVGRKIANLVLGDVFGIDGVVCDTHCIRITNRLGLSDTVYQEKVEKELIYIIPYGKRSQFCHRIVDFGRDICNARNPKCEKCGLHEYCLYFNDRMKNR